MRRAVGQRWIALAVGLAAASALVTFVVARRESAQRADLEARRRRILEALAAHATTAPAPESRRYSISPEDAATLFPRDATLETYDPWSYYRHKAGKRFHADWPEHPRGGWDWVTNSLGLREDGELSATRPDLRVLVTGDSHVDGFCDNSDAFPHRAQALLRDAQPGRSIEVLNAGNGGFSFYNYLGVVERFADLAPDAVVVTVYAGNDFQEILIPHAWFEHEPRPEETAAQQDELARTNSISTAASVQFFYSLVYFRQHPEAVETSLRAATAIVGEMRAACEARGARFLVVLIPGANDVEWGAHAGVFDRYVREFALSPEDLELHGRMSDDFLARVRAGGCETLDAREVLRPGPGGGGPWFWSKDFHLNLAGHAAIGKQLAERIGSWGGRFAGTAPR